MAEQRGLHLAGADPEAAGLDQIDRLAADDAVHAVAVDHRDVAGAVPAVGVERLGGGVGPVQVAVEHRRAPNLQSPNGFAVVRRTARRRRRPAASAPRSTADRPSPAGARPRRRVLTVISVSVLPYRSTGWWPVSSASLSNTGTGSAALPDTSSRADASARAASSVVDHPRPHRRHPEVQRALRRRRSLRAWVSRCARSGFRSAASPAARAPARGRGTAAARAPGCPRASTARPRPARRCRRRWRAGSARRPSAAPWCRRCR